MGNAWEQKMFSNEKKRLDIKNTPRNIQSADAQKKSPFTENFSDLTSSYKDICFGYIFFMTLIPVILFPETILATILGGKVPRI